MQTMQMERRTRAASPARARYVFAGSGGREDDEATKICPRCGEMLFSDMDVCYGCLYDFTRDRHGTARTADELGREVLGVPQALPEPPDLLAGIELDEIDEDEPVEEEPVRMPRHSKEAPPPALSPDDTLDLSLPAVTQPIRPPEAVPAAEPAAKTCWVVVSSPALVARLPLGPEGMTIGRDESNDLVLRDRSVSRRHLRLHCEGEQVMAEDLGATNPAELGGKPLREPRAMGEGDVLEICGTRLTLA